MGLVDVRSLPRCSQPSIRQQSRERCKEAFGVFGGLCLEEGHGRRDGLHPITACSACPSSPPGHLRPETMSQVQTRVCPVQARSPPEFLLRPYGERGESEGAKKKKREVPHINDPPCAPMRDDPRLQALLEVGDLFFFFFKSL
jgi:hypothetical protein